MGFCETCASDRMTGSSQHTTRLSMDMSMLRRLAGPQMLRQAQQTCEANAGVRFMSAPSNQLPESWADVVGAVASHAWSTVLEEALDKNPRLTKTVDAEGLHPFFVATLTIGSGVENSLDFRRPNLPMECSNSQFIVPHRAAPGDRMVGRSIVKTVYVDLGFLDDESGEVVCPKEHPGRVEWPNHEGVSPGISSGNVLILDNPLFRPHNPSETKNPVRLFLHFYEATEEVTPHFTERFDSPRLWCNQLLAFNHDVCPVPDVLMASIVMSSDFDCLMPCGDSAIIPMEVSAKPGFFSNQDRSEIWIQPEHDQFKNRGLHAVRDAESGAWEMEWLHPFRLPATAVRRLHIGERTHPVCHVCSVKDPEGQEETPVTPGSTTSSDEVMDEGAVDEEVMDEGAVDEGAVDEGVMDEGAMDDTQDVVVDVTQDVDENIPPSPGSGSEDTNPPLDEDIDPATMTSQAAEEETMSSKEDEEVVLVGRRVSSRTKKTSEAGIHAEQSEKAVKAALGHPFSRRQSGKRKTVATQPKNPPQPDDDESEEARLPIKKRPRNRAPKQSSAPDTLTDINTRLNKLQSKQPELVELISALISERDRQLHRSLAKQVQYLVDDHMRTPGMRCLIQNMAAGNQGEETEDDGIESD